MNEQQEEARTAGRGLLSITGAKIYFILASYAVQVCLPWLFGSPRALGEYATAMNLASILNNVLIAATVQSVSKHVSSDDARAPATLRQALLLQACLGGALMALILLFAPVIARQVLLDERLGALLQIASVVVLSYAVYAALVGFLNGRRLFQRQAALDVTFSTLRTVGTLTAAALGFGALGAVTGFAGAAVSVLLIALVVVGTGARGEGVSLRKWLAFLAPLWLYQAFLNGMLQIDLPVLKRTVAELGLEAGSAPRAAAELASQYAGFYSAAQKFAFVPYQLVLSMTFVIFPTISRATSKGDTEGTQRAIRGAMRFSLLVLLAVAAPIAGAADGVMHIAYPNDYLAGAAALRVLVFGTVAFALFVIAATVLTGAGRPAIAALIAGISLLIVVAANRFFVHATGISDATLVAAAAGTTTGTVIALLAVATCVYRTFGAFMAPVAVLRTSVAATVAFVVANVTPHDTRLMALVALAAGFASYLVALVVVRELSPQDLQTVKQVLGKKA